MIAINFSYFQWLFLKKETAAGILSYSSMRSIYKAGAYERLADAIFLAGLVLLTFISLVMVFEFI